MPEYIIFGFWQQVNFSICAVKKCAFLWKIDKKFTAQFESLLPTFCCCTFVGLKLSSFLHSAEKKLFQIRMRGWIFCQDVPCHRSAFIYAFCSSCRKQRCRCCVSYYTAPPVLRNRKPLWCFFFALPHCTGASRLIRIWKIHSSRIRRFWILHFYLSCVNLPAWWEIGSIQKNSAFTLCHFFTWYHFFELSRFLYYTDPPM